MENLTAFCDDKLKIRRILEICLLIIMVFISFCFVGYAIKYFMKNYFGDKCILISYIVSQISLILCIIALCICMYGQFSSNNCVLLQTVFAQTAQFFRFFGLSTLYLLYFLRLKCFKTINQVYNLSFTKKCTLVSLYFIQVSTILTIFIAAVYIVTTTLRIDVLLKLQKSVTHAIVVAMILWLCVYIIGCCLLLRLYIKKCISLIRLHNDDEAKTSQYTELLKVCIKYANCTATMLTTTMLSVLFQSIIAGIVVRNINAWHGFAAEINIIIPGLDCFINVIFTHFQFGYMNKYYIQLCDPFRVKINKIVNNQINLTNIHLSTQINEPNILSLNVDTTETLKTSTNAHGLEPTKTGDNDSLEPDSTLKYAPKIYFCRLCPLTPIGNVEI